MRLLQSLIQKLLSLILVIKIITLESCETNNVKKQYYCDDVDLLTANRLGKSEKEVNASNFVLQNVNSDGTVKIQSIEVPGFVTYEKIGDSLLGYKIITPDVKYGKSIRYFYYDRIAFTIYSLIIITNLQNVDNTVDCVISKQKIGEDSTLSLQVSVSSLDTTFGSLSGLTHYLDQKQGKRTKWNIPTTLLSSQ